MARILTPSMLLTDILSDLAGTNFFEKCRQRFAKPLGLMGDARPYKEEEGREHGYDQEIHSGDGKAAAARPFFDAGDRWIHQIREEDSEEKRNQRVVCDI